MTRTFVEVVFEANKEYLKGFLHGYVTGSGKEYSFYFSSDAGVEAESLSEKLKELTALADKYQHVLIEKGLIEILKKSYTASGAIGQLIKIKSAASIKSGKFSAKIKDASKKDATSIKRLIHEKPPEVAVSDWQENEATDKNGKGIELYAPLHEYIFEASGSFSGEIAALIEFRQKLTAHSTVVAGAIRLEFAD